MISTFQTLYFQERQGYVICCFVFLLLGLASLSSSINLLVLRFMILSLEEDAEEFDLQDVTQNVITVDEDLDGPDLVRKYALRQPETVSVCSCTCVPKNTFSKKNTSKSQKQQNQKGWFRNLLARWQRNFSEDDDHYFDEENLSITNSKKFAVKRNSL